MSQRVGDISSQIMSGGYKTSSDIIKAMNQNSGVAGGNLYRSDFLNGGINPNDMYSKIISEEQKALEKAKEQVVLEEKRLLELGKNQTQQSFLQKNKTYLLIAGAVVLGFLAYKKFKK